MFGIWAVIFIITVISRHDSCVIKQKKGSGGQDRFSALKLFLKRNKHVVKVPEPLYLLLSIIHLTICL